MNFSRKRGGVVWASLCNNCNVNYITISGLSIEHIYIYYPVYKLQQEQRWCGLDEFVTTLIYAYHNYAWGRGRGAITEFPRIWRVSIA